MKNFLQLFLLIVIVSCNKHSGAQVPIIIFQSIATGLSSPVDIANAGDGSNRLFIVQQTGTVRIYQNGALLAPAFLNITNKISYDGSERGFLSLAFHPDYINNRYFFVYYTNTAGDVTIARYRTDATNPNHCDSTTGVVLLTIAKPFSNHNGGKLNFGKDGKLYFGTGDGGSGGDPNNNAQNGNSLLGKMIRLNVDNFTTPPYYTIPADNPYTTDPNVRDEIWAVGLRNPWRWSFDKQTGDMWIADVGQNLWEEINFRATGTTGGINYGWRCYEGTHAYNTAGCNAASNYVSPIFEYMHNAAGGFVVTGGYVYRGTEYPFLNGYYFCVDYGTGNGWMIKSNGNGGWNTTPNRWITGISTFGEAENGSLYAATLSGTLYKINALNPIPLRLILFTAKDNNGTALLHWITEDEHIAKQFEVQQSPDGINFTQVGTVAANNTPVTNSYNFNYTPVSVYYRLKMVDLLNNFTYSPIVKITKSTKQIYPNAISNGVLNIYPAGNLKAINIFDATGRKMSATQYNNPGPVINIDVSTFAKGMYWVKMGNDNNILTEKIIVQ